MGDCSAATKEATELDVFVWAAYDDKLLFFLFVCISFVAKIKILKKYVNKVSCTVYRLKSKRNKVHLSKLE